MKPTRLRLTGYWKSFLEEQLPDPSKFVDENWGPKEKAEVVAYLRSGHQMPYAMAGMSWCRFHCGIVAIGIKEFNYGSYLWPEGFPHYLEKHNVKPPREFIDQCIGFTPKRVEIVFGAYEVDADWWLHQIGSNDKGPKTYDAHWKYDEAYLESHIGFADILIHRNGIDRAGYFKFLNECSKALEITPVQLHRELADSQNHRMTIEKEQWCRIKEIAGHAQFASLVGFKL